MYARFKNFKSYLILKKIYLLYKFTTSLYNLAHNGKYKLLVKYQSLHIICNFFMNNKSFFRNRERQSLCLKKMLHAAIRLEKFFRMLQNLCKMFILIIFSMILLKIIYMNILHNFCSILKSFSSPMAAFSFFNMQRLQWRFNSVSEKTFILHKKVKKYKKALKCSRRLNLLLWAKFSNDTAYL